MPHPEAGVIGLGIHRDCTVLYNSAMYKMDCEAKSCTSINILLGKITGHCSSVPSSSLANCRDSYM